MEEGEKVAEIGGTNRYENCIADLREPPEIAEQILLFIVVLGYILDLSCDLI